MVCRQFITATSPRSQTNHLLATWRYLNHLNRSQLILSKFLPVLWVQERTPKINSKQTSPMSTANLRHLFRSSLNTRIKVANQESTTFQQLSAQKTWMVEALYLKLMPRPQVIVSCYKASKVNQGNRSSPPLMLHKRNRVSKSWSQWTQISLYQKAALTKSSRKCTNSRKSIKLMIRIFKGLIV